MKKLYFDSSHPHWLHVCSERVSYMEFTYWFTKTVRV